VKLAKVFLLTTAPMLLAQAPAQDEAARRAIRADRARRAQQEFYQLRAWPGRTIAPGARLAALREMNRMQARERKVAPTAAVNPEWKLIGPRPTIVLAEQVNGGSPYSAGRVAAMAVDPRNANVAYLGAAGGGIWKTTDGGQNWTPLTDDQPSLSTGAIALAPSNPDIVFVGTGEQNNSGDSYYGAGILKSTDGGQTWTQIEGPFVGPFSASRTSGGGARIGAVAVHPTNPNVVLAAVDRTPASTAGIYLTTDGGSTWRLALGGAVGTDIVFNPFDASVVYAALGSTGGSASNGVYKSTDAGATWSRSGGSGTTALPATNVGRIALAIAPSSPAILYAGIQNSASQSLLGLYKSTDAGQNWSRVAAPDYCTAQCGYNNVVRVSPINPNVVVAAGLPPYRSTDGGATWTNIATGIDGLTAHTDHHALAFAADGSILYDGNDGGVFSTSTLGSGPVVWNNLNTTLAITEFSTNVSIHPADPKIAYAGTQDNGTLFYSGSMTWEMVVGGDGGSTAMDPAVPGTWYGAFQGPAIYKLSSVSAFNTIRSPFLGPSPVLNNGIALSDRFLAYGALLLDPSNPQRLYFASQRLYQSSDGAGTWTAISDDLTGGNGAITAIAISPANPQAIAIGTTTGRFAITDGPRSGASTPWANRSEGLPGRSITQIVFDPVERFTLYAVTSGFAGFAASDTGGHVFQSTDYGITWTDISSDLPNIPMNDIVADPDLPGTLYVASDIGIFQSSDRGQHWSTLSNGLPRVLVRSISLHRPSRTLRAVTYGRSMWDLALPTPTVSKAPRIDSVSPAGLPGSGPVMVTVRGSNFGADALVRWNGTDRVPTRVDASTLRITLSAADVAKPGRATILVFQPSAGAGLSNSVNVPVGPAPGFTPAGVASAATLATSPVVPGSIGSLVGTSLAAEAVAAGTPPLPYTLGAVTVEFNGIPAPLYYVSPTQINFQTPWELEGFDRATLTVTNGTLTSGQIEVRVATAAPALFSADGKGSGQGAILIAGTGVVAAPEGAFPGSRPAARGDFLEIYATGLGAVSRLQTDGQPKPPTTAVAISRPPTVTIGGVPAAVLFSGLASGGVGVFQINVQIPSGAPAGDAVPVVISVGGVKSNAVTIAVRESANAPRY
jgi:uncharacterized protein (TIGR03437 family)